MGGSKRKQSLGRELAVEALIDMHERGPSYRVGMIMDEGLTAALSSRPINITDAMILEKARSLSGYENKGEYLDADILKTQNDGFSTPTSTETKKESITGEVRERVMKHHLKIMKAKNTAFRPDVSRGPGAVAGATSPTSTNAAATVYPPSQLVSSLRKIYGIHSSESLDRLDSGKEDEESAAICNILPALLQFIIGHDIFAGDDKPYSKLDGSFGEKRDGDKCQHSLHNNISPIANIESLVGRACMLDEDDECIQGLLIAALSVLTTNILKNPLDDESTLQSDEASIDNLLNGLQVSGPLSLVSDSWQESELLESFGQEQFLPDKDLMNYLRNASSIYEERIEIKKTSINSEASATLLEKLTQLGIEKKESVTENQDDNSTGTNDANDAQQMPRLMERQNIDEFSSSSSDESVPEAMPALAERQFEDDSSSSDESVPLSDDSSESDDDDDDDDDDDNDNDNDNDNEDQEGGDGDSDNANDSQEEEIDRPLLHSEGSSSDSNEDDDEGADAARRNEASMLEEALAMSLAELSSAISSVANESSASASGAESGILVSDHDNREDKKNESDLKDDKASKSTNQAETRDKTIDKDQQASSKTRSSSGEGLFSSKNEQILPPFPKPPKNELFLSLWDKDDLEIMSEDVPHRLSRCLDPSALRDYGILPSSSVFIIILRMIISKMKKRGCKGQTNNIEVDKSNQNAENVKIMKGSRQRELEKMLRDLSFGDVKTRSTNTKCKEPSPSDNDLYLMIACLNLLSTARLEAFDHLCDELSAIGNEGVFLVEDDASPNDDDDGYNIDDPAFALCGEIVSEVAAQAASESLEEKGMVRKAAAAAHIAAVRKEKNHKRTEALRVLLHVLSSGSLLILRCLRLLLQEISSHQTNKSGPKLLSPLARLRLSTSIATFTSASVAAKLHNRIKEVSKCAGDRHGLFSALSSTSLLLEASKLWGESAPNLYTSPAQLDDQLRHLFEVLSKKSTNGTKSVFFVSDKESSMRTDVKFPWSNTDEQMLKLDSLCRRMQVTDVLDIFVPSPKIKVASIDDHPFHRPSETIDIIGKAILEGMNCSSFIAKNIQGLYYSLCHRFNIQIILWNEACDASEENLIKQKAQAAGERNGAGLHVIRDPELVFDSAKCAGSIAIESSSSPRIGSCTINQRANKVWGTVLSSKSFKPKSGIHQWAVKLDKCERGHIFIGVATSRASTKTYVGGDKFGWGVIGTQALWHDRKKIKSDYGKTFRTGSTIVVTLDTDAGTLGFSLWNEDNHVEKKKSTFPMSHARENNDKSLLEDWGIAFEGLPLDARLFPAVGMYQRDDKATLIGLEKIEVDNGSESLHQAGAHFYPPKSGLDSVRKWNSEICNEGIVHATNIMNAAVDMLTVENESLLRVEQMKMFQTVLPTIAACISAIPSSIPELSGRAAYNLLPLVLKCLSYVDDKIEEKSKVLAPITAMKGGSWMIKATLPKSLGYASGESFEEEYIVSFDIPQGVDVIGKEFTANGTGTSGLSSNKQVSISGSYRGNCIHFVEEWFDKSLSHETSSLCFIDAKLNLDGTRFEGTYRNAQHETSGMIIGTYEGVRSTDTHATDNLYDSVSEQSLQNYYVQCSYLLGRATSHLTLILDQGAPALDHDSSNCCIQSSKRRSDLSKLLVSSPILSIGLQDNKFESTKSQIERIHELYMIPKGRLDSPSRQTITSWHTNAMNLLSRPKESQEVVNTSAKSIDDDTFHKIDALIKPRAGGTGSLSSVHPAYHTARKCVIKVLLHHTQRTVDMSSTSDMENISEIYVKIWRCALSIIENGVRAAISKTKDGKSRAERCRDFCGFIQSHSAFLLQLHPSGSSLTLTLDSIKELYRIILCEEEISFLSQSMKQTSRNSILKYIGLTTVKDYLGAKKYILSTSETLLIAFYRIMGATFSDEKSKVESQLLLPGSNRILQKNNLFMAKSIFSAVEELSGEIMVMQSSNDVGSFESCPTIQTLFSVIFICFFSPIGAYMDVLKGAILWDLIRSLFSRCLNELKDADLNETDFSDVTSQVSTWIRGTSSKHTNLDLLKTSIQLLHTVLYQLHEESSVIADFEAHPYMLNPLSLLKTEILFVFMQLKERDAASIGREKNTIAAAEYARYVDNAKDCPANEFLLENMANITEDKRSIPFPGYQDSRITSLAHYLSHLLNAFSTLLRNPIRVEKVHNDFQFFKHLLNFVVEDDFTGDKPGMSQRYKIRVLRLLRIVLPYCAPDAELVSLLLSHTGNAQKCASFLGTSLDSDFIDLANFEAKETVSLIRYLYSSSYTTAIPWRETIISCCEAFLDEGDEKEACVHSVFGGMPGCVAPGSFVLLKPPIVKNLQTSHQVKSGSEPRSLSGNFSPVPSGGIEGIVSGLCRKEARGGMISRICHSTSTCEVVLFDRDDSLRKPNFNSQAKRDSNISVRAMRVPLSEISLAEESAIVFDTSFPLKKIVKESLERHLLAALSNSQRETDGTEAFTEEKLEPTEFLSLALSLRCNISILSNDNLFQVFLKDNSSRQCLSSLLQFASLRSFGRMYSAANSASGQSLKALPKFEARFWHLQNLALHLRKRRHAVATGGTNLLQKCQNINAKVEETRSAESDLRDNHSTTEENQSVDDSGDRSEDGRGDNLDRDESVSGSNNDVSDEEEEGNNEEDNEASVDDIRNRSSTEYDEMAHLREAAIVQMLELGLPRSWSEYALNRVGGTNIEAAVHFCLERGGEMERLLAEDHERSRSSTTNTSSRRRNSPQLLQQLVEMGFPSHWCAEALDATGQNVDEALTWILTNGERLSALDEGENEEDAGSDSEDVEEDESSDDEKAAVATVQRKDEHHNETVRMDIQVWPETFVCPVRSISGRATIDARTLDISGLSTGGFSSVGTKGLLLTEGKWYYECVLITAGCIQIGWADSSFSGHCQADRGDGCGDGPSSWAYDGWRRYRWHNNATEWGCRWKSGDVVGCLVDMDNKEMRFTLNGRGDEIGMGLAFAGSGFKPCGGVYACVSFNRKEKVRFVLGGSDRQSFHFSPPSGYMAVGEAVVSSAEELNRLKVKETAFTGPKKVSERKPYICDFSGSEHGHEIFAWQHRYYGSDASVHLGVGRRRQDTGTSQSRKIPLLYKLVPDAEGTNDSNLTLDLILSEAWKSKSIKAPKQSTLHDRIQLVLKEIMTSYDSILGDIQEEISDITLALSVLYARKLIMHIAISTSSAFQLDWFSSVGNEAVKVAQQFTSVLESCCSLHDEGWVGEAGTMSVASEALGLAISSNERSSHRQSISSLLGGKKRFDSESRNNQKLPSGAITQVLNTVCFSYAGCKEVKAFDPSNSLAACAEVVLGGEGVGSVIFVKCALQTVVTSNKAFVDVLLGYIRQSVRMLANIEYQENESPNSKASSDADSESSASTNSASEVKAIDGKEPDARLISFLTGLLMSGPIKKISFGDSQSQFIANSLFEAWSIGLLAQSVPWRMVSAMTISSLLNICPFNWNIQRPEIMQVSHFFNRLNSITSRRIWAERAAIPVCSRYLQALLELQSSVASFPSLHPLKQITSDAATPSPLKFNHPSGEESVQDYTSWEADEGWVYSDKSWEIWKGTVEYFEVDWSPPSRSAVRSLMDGGEGPPMLEEGCTVLRGLDWNKDGSGCTTGEEDGKESYDTEKSEREKAKNERQKSRKKSSSPSTKSQGSREEHDDPVAEEGDSKDQKSSERADSPSATPIIKKKKKKKLPLPKLPIGTVLSIEPWNGVPGLGRRVRWDSTGEESIYRYGGDGGRFDIVHVEVNDKATRVVKRHPHSETLEQCAMRHGFGAGQVFNVLLRVRKSEMKQDSFDGETEYVCSGILEWPDFGAGVEVQCRFHEDGAVTITEENLLFGSKDSGWEARFGEPSFVPGTTVVLSSTSAVTSTHLREDGVPDEVSSFILDYELLLGSTSFAVKRLRNRAGGQKVRIASEMRLAKGKSRINGDRSSILPPITFDSEWHASSLSISRDRRTVTCTSAEGRNSAFLSAGFSKGVHYWEVKIEQADVGSVYIGVAEKPRSSTASSGNSFEGRSRLNRWLGLGFVNFRATYSEGSERVYGSHCHAGDTVGVLLDCDSGRLSFFFDGVKYGEHILNDLGCAFENISPFGFNADGCGGGGAGQGAPSGGGGRGGRYPANGTVRPKTLWPVIGLRHPGDRVTVSRKWMTSFGVDGPTMLKNAMLVDEFLKFYNTGVCNSNIDGPQRLPEWVVKESFEELKRWEEGRWTRTSTRASGPLNLSSFGLNIDIDASAMACAAACACLGLKFVLLPGDRVKVKRSAGRILELSEEAEVLGSFQGKLWYKIVSQKSEGGSLVEGGGRAWFWDESEIADGGLQLIHSSPVNKIDLPLLDRFKCMAKGGLRITYSSGAVVRSDIEIHDHVSRNIGVIPVGTIIPCEDVMERRVNSNGLVRFLVKYEPVGKGWISCRIQGGNEEDVLELVTPDDAESNIIQTLSCQYECAEIWLKKYKQLLDEEFTEEKLRPKRHWIIDSYDEFQKSLSAGLIHGLDTLQSDTFLSQLVTSIADSTAAGSALDCSYDLFCCTLYHALKAHDSLHASDSKLEYTKAYTVSHETAAWKIGTISCSFPPMKALLARIALLRTLNRRSKYALPLYSIRPPQEDSAIVGGLAGFGASVERLGKSRKTESLKNWVQAPSIGNRVRKCRGLLFTSVKKDLLNSIVESTTTPTTLSHDEYELPRDIRTVRVNRLKARKTMSSSGEELRRENTVFGQLQTELKGWSGSALRRGYIAKGHGGQKRAFKVKLIGEGVNDYSGPYREVFTDAMREVNQLGNSLKSALGILEPSPNKEIGVGENRNLSIFASARNDFEDEIVTFVSEEEKVIRSHYSSHLIAKSEKMRDLEESLIFLGKLASTAVRHGIPVDIDLPLSTVWKRLCEEDVDSLDGLKEIDLIEYRRLEQYESCVGGDITISSLLVEQQRMFNAFAEGISSIMPVEVFPIFSGKELRDYFCGNSDIDVDLLRKVVEYEGYEEDDAVITSFWEILREMTTEEKKLFLQFVWARSRMPLKESDFDAPFKILKDTKCSGNNALPSASTCFFSLSLPEYDNKEKLREKLLFAIKNVTTMESDYVTNDVEIGEGWRGL